MTTIAYDRDRTALVIVDPYNDFMSKGRNLYERTRETAEAVGFYDNMKKLIPTFRAAHVQVIIVPHHRWRDGNLNGWKHINPSQSQWNQEHGFAAGSWGREFHPEFGPREGNIIALEHWAQNGFTTTDLDVQLKQHGIKKIILVGKAANTCVGMEFGYHVTLVRNATAAFNAEGMHAALGIDAPMYAHAILTTGELLDLLPSK